MIPRNYSKMKRNHNSYVFKINVITNILKTISFKMKNHIKHGIIPTLSITLFYLSFFENFLPDVSVQEGSLEGEAWSNCLCFE